MIHFIGENNLTESPAYSIQVFSERDSFDPSASEHDRKVLIIAYITGEGNIDEAKITGYIPDNLITGKIMITSFNFHRVGANIEPSWPINENLEGNHFNIKLANGYFSPVPNGRIRWSESDIRNPETSEVFPPLSFSFTISAKAYPGDHKIEFIFKYKSADDVWSISKAEIIIHIIDWVEKYSIGLSILCGAIISICIGALFWILSRSR